MDDSMYKPVDAQTLAGTLHRWISEDTPAAA
jgi:hypothetical protein